jgi:uncharacterized protein YjiS (DUF1127 family)
MKRRHPAHVLTRHRPKEAAMRTQAETLPCTFVDRRASQRGGATWPAAIASGWLELRSRFRRWSARQRLSRSIAHLSDRQLADAGFCLRDLGLGERLIRRHVAGGDIWVIGTAGRSPPW